MERAQIIAELKRAHNEFLAYIDFLTNDEYGYAPEGKWTAGQHTIHLIKSTSPLIKALSAPKFLLKTKFGKANRPSRTYEEVVSKYKLKLTAVTLEDNPFGPKTSESTDREKVTAKLLSNVEALNKKLEKWSEEQLDEFILPHPLLGKVTIREMMYFTIYHTDHHRNLIKLYLKGV